MVVVAQEVFREFWKRHNQAETPLRSWYTAVTAAHWRHFQDVKAMFAKADRARQFTVFNISGNKWRLIARIDYTTGTVAVRHVFTHAEYDDWTEALRKGKAQ